MSQRTAVGRLSPCGAGLLVISGGRHQGAALFSSLQAPWGGAGSRSPVRPDS